MAFHQSDKETSLPYQIKEKDNVFAYNFKKRINGQANVFFSKKKSFCFVSAFQEILRSEKFRRMEPILSLISLEEGGELYVIKKLFKC